MITLHHNVEHTVAARTEIVAVALIIPAVMEDDAKDVLHWTLRLNGKRVLIGPYWAIRSRALMAPIALAVGDVLVGTLEEGAPRNLPIADFRVFLIEGKDL
jgi:hypothetical protein